MWNKPISDFRRSHDHSLHVRVWSWVQFLIPSCCSRSCSTLSPILSFFTHYAPPPSFLFFFIFGIPNQNSLFLSNQNSSCLLPNLTFCDANPPCLRRKGHTCTIPLLVTHQHLAFVPTFPTFFTSFSWTLLYPTYPEVSPLSSGVDHHPQASPSSPSLVLRLPSSWRALLPLTRTPIVRQNAMRLDSSRPHRAMLEDGLGWTRTYS